MDALWVILTLGVAGGLGWPLTTAVLRLARAVDAQEDEDDGGPGAADSAPDRAGVLRGGLVIGILERVGIAVAVLADEPVAIAYIVAIKGLGRYAELKETPAAAERFIIGTLTSMLWASGVSALAVRYLL